MSTENPRDIEGLTAGDRHYRAFVGPTARYDVLGAGQLSLLYLLGLRETHSVLDFGCGSLRLGRLLIPLLQPGRYFGIEPEAWLVEEGFTHELGQDARALKKPRFDHNRDFRTDVFGETFDFIMAQSIFSHAGSEMTRKALAAFKASLAPGGMIVANWLTAPEIESLHPDRSDWVYPGVVPFEESRIFALAAEAGLSIRRCHWRHPGRLVWYVLAADADDLPDQAFLEALAVTPRGMEAR
ncbi:class I SAM-dependent methyltransferase [Brevundimonas sp.]